jgi:MFS family permease
LFTKRTGLIPRLTIANVVLVATAFIWYFLAYSILEQLIGALQVTNLERLTVLGVNVTAIAAAAIIGTFFAGKLNRREQMLSLWMFVGIFVSLIPFVYIPSTFFGLLVVSVIFGGYFGLGMPAVMGYFSMSTAYENRGKLGGIIFLVIGFGFFLVDSMEVRNINLAIIVLALVQIVGSLLFIGFKTNMMFHESKDTSYLRILSSRPILLFLVPWFIFNMVNYMTIPVASRLSQGYEDVQSFSLLENIITAIFASVTGFLADSFGRKRLAIAGFAMLGLGYAAIGFFQGSFGWYIHTIADGVAWGMLYVLFLFTLWGDLAQDYKSEKFYVIGSLPFLFSNFMTLLLAPLISGIQPVALFSFASFFLFLAVLPLFYAPETLPTKIMKAQDLKSYVNKAMEKAKKEMGNQKKEDKENREDKEEKSEEYKEAQKLAEKYY